MFSRSYALILLGFLAATVPSTARAGTSTDEGKVTGVHWGGWPVSKYSTDSGFTLGAFARRFDYGDPGESPFKTLLTLQTTYSTRGPRGALISYEKTGFTDSNLRLYMELDGFTNPFQNYFGTGDSTAYTRLLDSQNFYEYTLQGALVFTSLRKHTDSGWDLQGGLQLPYLREIANSGSTQYAQDFGTQIKENFSGRLLAMAIYDGRDSEFIPSRGYLATAALTVAPGVLGADSTWQRADLDFRFLVPVLDNRWFVIANQVRYSESSPGTPITDKARLGSASTLRGLPNSRYLSNDSFTLRSELRTLFARWKIFGMPLKGGMGIFGDTGKIGDTFPRMVTNPLQRAWGFTFFGSYFTDDFLGSADIGFSRDGTAVYIGLGHAI